MEVMNHTQVDIGGGGGALKGRHNAEPAAAAHNAGPEINTVATTAGHTWKS